MMSEEAGQMMEVYDDHSDQRSLSLDDTSSMEESPDETRLSLETTNDAIPYIGQRFTTHDAAYDFYSEFAKRNGFSIRRHRTEGKDGIGKGLTRRYFVCHRAGNTPVKALNENKPQRNRKSSRCNCQAYMRISKTTELGAPEWRVTGFGNNHNHELLEANQVRFLPAYRTISDTDKSRILMFAKTGISVQQMMRLMELEKCVEPGYLPFTEKDVRNLLQSFRKVDPEDESIDLLRMCRNIKDKDPNFQFEFTLDSNNRLENIAWSYPSSIQSYEIFGDAVVFDTTHRLTVFDMPLGIWVGMNNYGMPCFFGCVLLREENLRSFSWALKAFLVFMNGKAPQTMLTDQNMCLKEAISMEMPTTKHALCIWLIVAKFPSWFNAVLGERQNTTAGAKHHGTNAFSLYTLFSSLHPFFKSISSRTMPLYKRKPFSLLENPNNLMPEELVFQVRFTKEIFRDYGEYLNRINLYRQRVWTCKVTGKSNLTFEEALVSEGKAIEKVQQFPGELVAPVLRDVQFSMLKLKDLVNTIAAKLQERMLEGSELYGRKNNRIYPCKIVKVLTEEADKTQYQVAWLDKEKNITGNAVVDGEDLIRKKLPFSRDVLKSFIRESTYRSVPWVLHDNLAQKHGISTDPPEEIRHKVCLKDGRVVTNRKRKKNEETNKKALRESKRKDSGIGDEQLEEPKYPIDDLLVHPAADDPDLAQRPSPSRDFNIPMDCVGDVLMVWDFCSSFSRLLHLWPFSLDDFENALCNKDSNVILIVESHSALLRLLMKDNGEYHLATQKKKRKPKITLITWTEFLCDFLEMIGNAEFSSYITTIRRGHYGLLHLRAKLGILRELVARVLATELVREKLDEYIEERQTLAATNREEALAEGRKKREDKEQKKLSSGMQVEEVSNVNTGGTNSSESVKYYDNKQNGFIQEKRNEPALNYSKSEQENSTLKKNVKEQMVDRKVAVGSIKHSYKKGVPKLMTDDRKETTGKRSLELRKEYLEREMEKRIIRTNPLGKDRYHNRYWFFRHNPRVYIESSDSTQWGYYITKDELDSFLGSLNRKGERERALKKQLENCYGKICSELQKRLKDKVAMEEADVRRSTRVRAPPRDNPALAFLKYFNKWKED